MPLLRQVIGAVLRRARLAQGRTLREVADAAGVSVPYLSEVERGRKEASSEVLAAICRALGLYLSELMEQARDELRRLERRVPVPVRFHDGGHDGGHGAGAARRMRLRAGCRAVPHHGDRLAPCAGGRARRPGWTLGCARPRFAELLLRADRPGAESLGRTVAPAGGWTGRFPG